MPDAPFVTVGRIVKAHGLKGEVSVAPAADLPFVLHEGLHVWLTPPPPSVRDGVVESIRPGPKGPLVKISGLNDIEHASQARGCSLMARPVDIPGFDEIQEPDDLLGIVVTADDGDELGILVEIIETGANDVWVVRGDTHGEVLLPVIDDVVLEIDHDAHAARVHVLPGLIDEKDPEA